MTDAEDQSILQAFLIVSKEASHKPFKVACAKKSFPSVLIIDTNYFNECFSFHIITAKGILYTNLSLPRGLVQLACCCVLSNKRFERIPHFISITSTIITMMLIAKVQNKA